MSADMENATNFGDYSLPEELLCDLMRFYLDADALIQCQQVCKQWNILLKGYVWRCKAEQQANCKFRGNEVLRARDYCRIYARRLYGRNLIGNHSGGKQLEAWTNVKSGGHGWKVECPPVGAPPLPDDADYGGDQHCFVTSYGNCSKTYVVDLLAEGFTETILDEQQSPIVISEIYSSRFDCATNYIFHIELRTDTDEVLATERFLDVIRDDRLNNWFQYKITLRDYGKGVRRIHFTHTGKDRQFWAGHYGTKMARASVKFLPPSATIPPNAQTNRLTSVDLSANEFLPLDMDEYVARLQYGDDYYQSDSDISDDDE